MKKDKKIGAVSYLNTRPLIHGLEDLLPGYELILDLPSRLADRLSQGELAAALVPVVEVMSTPSLTIVSDACIACHGPVWSVKILSHVPIDRITSIALDEGSRTSVCLTRLLLRHCIGIFPAESMLGIGEDWRNSTTDAVLIIGDRAMNDEDGGYAYRWDLGELWRSWTGLPFVFAVWAASPGTELDRLGEVLEQARNGGVASTETLAHRYSSGYHMSPEKCREYFDVHLRFSLGLSERAGLDRFAQLILQNRLIINQQPLVYHDLSTA